MTALESDLVQECRVAAKAMNCFLVEMGQRKAKGSGSTRGLPDLAVLCNGQTVWIEVKRPKTADHPHGYLSLAQSAFIAASAEQGVEVRVVDCLEDFVGLLNSCRSSHGVRRTW
jgi:hypothetical protein